MTGKWLRETHIVAADDALKVLAPISQGKDARTTGPLDRVSDRAGMALEIY
jgi:hypothetical protein